MLTTGFDRKNLYFAVETPKDRYAAIRAYPEAHPGQGGIIYCPTRRNVEEIREEADPGWIFSDALPCGTFRCGAAEESG